MQIKIGRLLGKISLLIIFFSFGDNGWAASSSGFAVNTSKVRPIPYSERPFPIMISKTSKVKNESVDHITVNLNITCYGQEKKVMLHPLAMDSDILVFFKMANYNYIFLYPAYELFQEFKKDAVGEIYQCPKELTFFEECWEKKKKADDDSVTAGINGQMVSTTMVAGLSKESPGDFEHDKTNPQFFQIKHKGTKQSAIRKLDVGHQSYLRNVGIGYLIMSIGVASSGQGPRAGKEGKKQMDQAGMFNYCGAFR